MGGIGQLSLVAPRPPTSLCVPVTSRSIFCAFTWWPKRSVAVKVTVKGVENPGILSSSVAVV